MKRFTIPLTAALAVAATSLLPGCNREPAQPVAKPKESSGPAPTNRTDIPATVRQNLGITFAKVENQIGRASCRERV